jgi:hypothetical protein
MLGKQVRVLLTLHNKVLDECGVLSYASAMLERRPHRLRHRMITRPPAPAALEDLRFIRQTLERSSAFTAVSGWGLAGLGLTAFPAAWIAHRQTHRELWLAVWLGEALIAVTIALSTTYAKAIRASLPLTSGPAQRFVLSFLPPAISAAILTAALFHSGAEHFLPAVWLLLYGASIVTAGTFSVQVLPVMGVCFMVVGTVTLFMPFPAADWLLASGFGGLHLIFGTLIARRYGG